MSLRMKVCCIVVPMLFWIGGFFIFPTVMRYRFEQNLSERIQHQAAWGVAKLDLQTLTDFEWDALYLFGPYTPLDKISKILGTKYRGPNSIEYSDGINLLVFMKNGEVVQYAEIGRSIEFCDSKNVPWTPHQSLSMKVDGKRINIENDANLKDEN
jgi:hypothetical protein